MKDIFPSYYRLSEPELREAWKTCTFILDANVLLNFYRYSADVRQELLKILTDLGDRVWVPYHAALEYQRNRTSVISEQGLRFSEAKAALVSVRSGLSDNFNRLQLRDRHSLIDPDKIIQDVGATIEKYQEELAKLETEQISVHQHDDIREVLDKLLDGKIGPPPTAADIESICGEAAARFAARMPPGFMDERKADGPEAKFSFGGITYEARLGDLIIWKQIIAFSKLSPAKFIMFVTDDEKPDWWWIVEDHGKKKLGARPELTEELIRDGAASGFHIYNTKSFMVNAKKHIRAKVSDDSITQVEQVVSEKARTELTHSFPESFEIRSYGESDTDFILRNMKSIIVNWVAEQNPASNVMRSLSWPDVLVTTSVGLAGYETLIATTPTSIMRRLREAIDRGRMAISRNELVRHEIIAVSLTTSGCDELFSLLKGRDFQLPDNITVTIGWITDADRSVGPRFRPIFRFSELGVALH